MPLQEFALDPTGTERVQIFQEGSSEGEILILLNNAIIGSISHREELRAGKKLALKSGSQLLIQQTNEGYQVLCDGQPLHLMSPADIQAVQKRAVIPQREESLKEGLKEILTSDWWGPLGRVAVLCIVFGALILLTVFPPDRPTCAGSTMHPGTVCQVYINGAYDHTDTYEDRLQSLQFQQFARFIGVVLLLSPLLLLIPFLRLGVRLAVAALKTHIALRSTKRTRQLF